MANLISFIYSGQLLLLITSCISTSLFETVNDRSMKRRSTPFEEYVIAPYSYAVYHHILKTLSLSRFNAEFNLQDLSDLVEPDNTGYSRFNEICTALGIALWDASKDPNFIDRDAMNKFRFCDLCEDSRTKWMPKCSHWCCTLGLKSTYSDGCPGNKPGSPPKGC